MRWARSKGACLVENTDRTVESAAALNSAIEPEEASPALPAGARAVKAGRSSSQGLFGSGVAAITDVVVC